MNNLVTTVFKVIIISSLMLCIVGSAANIYMAFNTINKIDAVAQAMKSELSRNNSILDTSTSLSNSGNFATQLAEITSTSGEVLRKGSTSGGFDASDSKQFILKAVYIMPSSETAFSDEYKIIDTHQSANNYKLNADGTIDTSNWETCGSKVGNYGDFYNIVFVYDVVIDILSTASADEIKNGSADTDKSMSIKGATFIAEQQFTYTVPCLRYMK